MQTEPMKQSTNPLVKAAVVARHLGISTATVYRMANRGLIPSVHAGRAIRFDLDAVLRALAA